MAQVYFYINALLYASIAIWATLNPEGAGASMGYGPFGPDGRSEFLTVYGGMVTGLALIFVILAWDTTNAKLGLLIAIAFYAPVLCYRIATGIGHYPMLGILRGAVILEAALLLSALVLYYRHR